MIFLCKDRAISNVLSSVVILGILLASSMAPWLSSKINVGLCIKSFTEIKHCNHIHLLLVLLLNSMQHSLLQWMINCYFSLL